MNLGDFLALGMDEQRQILDAASRQSRSKALLDSAIGLLRVAVCPECDGSGVVPVQVSARQYVTAEMASDAGQPEMAGSLYCDDEWEPQQCEWCDVRQRVIADCEADAKRIAVDMAADRQDLFLRSGGRDEDTAKRWEKR